MDEFDQTTLTSLTPAPPLPIGLAPAVAATAWPIDLFANPNYVDVRVQLNKLDKCGGFSGGARKPEYPASITTPLEKWKYDVLWTQACDFAHLINGAPW